MSFFTPYVDRRQGTKKYSMLGMYQHPNLKNIHFALVI